MSLKDILLAGATYKALKQSNPPGVFAPATCTITGMKHQGMGSRWKISYVRNDVPNVTQHFTVTSGTSSVMIGADRWEINWG